MKIRGQSEVSIHEALHDKLGLLSKALYMLLVHYKRRSIKIRCCYLTYMLASRSCLHLYIAMQQSIT